MEIDFLSYILLINPVDIPKAYRRHVRNIQSQKKLNNVHLYILSHIERDINHKYQLSIIPYMLMRGYTYSVMKFIMYIYMIKYRSKMDWYTSCSRCYPKMCKSNCCYNIGEYKNIPSAAKEICKCHDDCCVKFSIRSQQYKSIIPY